MFEFAMKTTMKRNWVFVVQFLKLISNLFLFSFNWVRKQSSFTKYKKNVMSQLINSTWHTVAFSPRESACVSESGRGREEERERGRSRRREGVSKTERVRIKWARKQYQRGYERGGSAYLKTIIFVRAEVGKISLNGEWRRETPFACFERLRNTTALFFSALSLIFFDLIFLQTRSDAASNKEGSQLMLREITFKG